MNVSFEKTPNAAGSAPESAPVIDVQTVKTEVQPTAPATAPAAPVAPTAPIDVAPAAAIPTAPAAAPTQAVAPTAPTQAVSPYAPNDDENLGYDDIILPRINIVQKVGDLSVIFEGGHIVLNQQVDIHEPADTAKSKPGTGPLIITVLGFRKRQYAEKVEGGKLGLLLNDESEIAKNNGTLDYKEWEASKATPTPKRLFQRLATAFLLVEKPAHLVDEDHTVFPYDFNGKYYALALWSMKGTGYTNGAKPLFTARKISYLRDGYTAQSLSLTSKLEKFNDNYAYVPVLRPATKNSPEFREFCKGILG
jgi:hypothetical protein